MTAGKALPDRVPVPLPCGVCGSGRVRLINALDILACRGCDRMDVWPTKRVTGG